MTHALLEIRELGKRHPSTKASREKAWS